MMLELIICCFLVFAVAYWATLWTAGRREDVLHGQFVEHEPEAERGVFALPPPVVFPSRAAARPAIARKPTVVAAPAPPPAQPASTDKLQSLLASIKSELKNAAQI
jgi:hypothetical protein